MSQRHGDQSALALLRELGASDRLIRHHQLVSEAAAELVDAVVTHIPTLDTVHVRFGAAIHDVGKFLHPEELSAPGHAHEEAGEHLLIGRGVPPHLARACVRHAQWDQPDTTLEELLIALADKLWKGKRVARLEERVFHVVADASGVDFWAVFTELDTVFERIAADGDLRLARSARPSIDTLRA